MVSDRNELRGEVEAAMRAASEGLRMQFDVIEQRLAETQKQIDRLRSDRAYVVSAIRRFDPDFDRAPKGRGPRPDHNIAAATDPVKVARVRRWIEEHGNDDGDGFSVTKVRAGIDAEDGLPPAIKDRIGLGALAQILQDMHTRGEIRADRKTAGGGTIYKTVGGKPTHGTE